MKYSLHLLVLLFVLATFLGPACFKRNYDAPPDQRAYDPMLRVTHTIAQLQDYPQGAAITEEMTVSGIVVMDDRSGNYFKKIVIQDTTGGIELLLDQQYLYQDYPVGRKIYVRCKGLIPGNAFGKPQLGGPPDANGYLSPIAAALLERYIVKASYPHILVPDTLSLEQLAEPDHARRYLNTLVAIKEVAFSPQHAGKPYAQPPDVAAVTRLMIKDCYGGSIQLPNSGYARFQSYLTPLGKGTLQGIYSRYNEVPQLSIRDTHDVRFYENRCDSSVSLPLLTIDSLRKLFPGTEVTLPALRIRGVVISDRVNGNVSGGAIVFQGGAEDRGILLYYGGNPDYLLGDSLEIDLTGALLKSFKGKLEVEGITPANTVLLASGRSISPRELTIAQVLADFPLYESTLIRIKNVVFQHGLSTYYGHLGNLDILDATGTLRHYAPVQCTFKEEPLPVGPVTLITGYLDIIGTTPQLRIRKPGAPVYDVVP